MPPPSPLIPPGDLSTSYSPVGCNEHWEEVGPQMWPPRLPTCEPDSVTALCVPTLRLARVSVIPPAPARSLHSLSSTRHIPWARQRLGARTGINTSQAQQEHGAGTDLHMSCPRRVIEEA